MRIFRIKKRVREYRTIYAPSPTEKAALRKLMPDIVRRAEHLSPVGVCHGFVTGRSPVTNAMAHRGYRYTISFDLEDFFDSVTGDLIGEKLSPAVKKQVLVKGAARQGLPTSPAVANLAACSFDQAILLWRDKNRVRFVYTRYADDLTFSFDDPALADKLLLAVPKIVRQHGFAINKTKTRLQQSRRGRRIITGVAVDDKGELRVPRRVKRKLRAAQHQRHRASAHGLSEWSKLKLPKKWDKQLPSDNSAGTSQPSRIFSLDDE